MFVALMKNAMDRRDVTAAATQARAWVDTTAGAKVWSAGVQADGHRRIDAAADGAADVPEFWALLDATWGESNVGGWNKLGAVWPSAGNAEHSRAAAESAASPVNQVWGAAVATVEEVAVAANPKKSPLPWLVGGVAALLLYGYVK